MKQNTTPTLPRLAALKAEAVATATNQPVMPALCSVCGQPTAQWVVAQNAALTTENERLNKELMHPDTGGDEDGFWWFVVHMFAFLVVFGLGWVGGAV